MDLVIKQYIDRTETVSSSLIDALYHLTKPDTITGQSLANAVLVGRIQSTAAYEDAVNFLNTQFSSAQDNGSDFQVTVLNNNYYIRFADPEVVRVLNAKGVMQEGEGLTVAQANELPTGASGAYENWWADNTTIKEFNEIKYFGKVKNGTYQMGGWFLNATNLESVDLTGFNKLFGYRLFENCKNLEYFHGRNNTPNTLNLEDLTYLNASFNGCLKLYHIASLGSITSIGGSVFTSCTNLETVNLPSSCIDLGSNCFKSDSKLHTINLSHVTAIRNNAFEGCSSLEYCDGPNSTQGELNLPNLTLLDGGTFRGCTKLTSITSLGSITSIRGGTFENCTSLATITFPGSINSVGENAFNNTPWYNSQNNTAIYIDNVLYKCKGTIPSSLVIPNNVVSITDNAFRSITSLESLTIGSGVNSIGVGEAIFFGCTNLETIVVDSNNAKYNSGNGSNAIIETATNTLVAGCKGTSIPNSVTKIASRAFGNNKGITSINLNNVSEIGDYAFAGDSNLITVSQGNLTKLTEGAFNGCSSLQTIDISNVTTFGSGIFYNCSALNNVTLSSSLSTISSNLFRGCSSLTSITIPNSVTSISDSAFNGCSSLTSVIIPNSVTSIGASAFYGTKITSIEFPEGLTTISHGICCWCSALTTAVLPSTTTKIADIAFSQCGNLQYLTVKAITPPTLGGSVFLNTHQNLVIYVPSGNDPVTGKSYVDIYKEASGWSAYASRIQAIPTT